MTSVTQEAGDVEGLLTRAIVELRDSCSWIGPGLPAGGPVHADVRYVGGLSHAP